MKNDEGLSEENKMKAFWDNARAQGAKPGLERIRILLDELGNPQDKLRFVHIAGTNGKGSVMAFLEQTLMEAGFTVGRFLSPALFRDEEMIRVNKRCITAPEAERLTGLLYSAQERAVGRGGEYATVFEAQTALAFLFFLENNCGIVLLECGMGGQDDATNIISTGILEIFSSISMDHMQYLGEDIGQIAWNKAGIIKKGVRAVSDRQRMAAQAVLMNRAMEQQAKLTFVSSVRMKDLRPGLYTQQLSYSGHKDIEIHLPGIYQLENAALALEAVDALTELGLAIPEEAVRKGFADTRWECRFEIVREEPVVILDGAHNPDAAAELRRSLLEYFPGKRFFFIIGVFADKDYGRIIDVTADLACRIFTVQAADNPRALDAGILAEAIRSGNPEVECVGDVKKAVRMALSQAEKEDVVVMFGSLAWLWEARSVLSDSI